MPSPASHRRRGRREDGIVLILSMFVILLLLVIVPQFRFSAAVDRDLAFNAVEDLQMEELARSAMMRAQAALLLDLEEDSSEGSELDSAGSGTAGGGASAGGLPSDAEQGESSDAGAEPAGPHNDSLDEVWATGELTFSLGDEAGFKTRIEVTDEDSKLNLLLLFAEDDLDREEWRDRFERALDLMRDGKSEDLSLSDAGDVLDRITRWMEGDRPHEEIEVAPLASGDWRTILGRPVHAPFSLAELCLGGGIPPRLLHGFGVGEEDEHEWLPGLAQGFTVLSNLEVVDVKPEEEQADAEEGDGLNAKRQEAPGVNNGRINVNTAPAWVLKSLFPDHEIPWSAWDQYDEFRRTRLEEIEQERKDLAGLTDSEKEDRRAQEDDETSAKYPLKSIEDLRKVDGFSPDTTSIAPDKWSRLLHYLTVESNVFTITVMIGTQEEPRRFYVARSVVWRQSEAKTPLCIPIVPYERVATSSVDLKEFAEELQSWSEHYAD